MTDMHDPQSLETLYGPLYPYSDHKRGDHITFRGERVLMLTGVVIWVSGPQEIAGTRTGVQYIVEPERGGMPDVVMPSDIIE